MSLNRTQSTTIHWVRFFCSQAVVLSHLFVFFQWNPGPFTAMGSYAVLVFFFLYYYMVVYLYAFDYLVFDLNKSIVFLI